MANAEFRSLFADRVQWHCFGNDAFTPAGQLALWNVRGAEIDQAVIGESACWVDSTRATTLTREKDWVPRMNYFRNSRFPARTGTTDFETEQVTVHAPSITPQFFLRMRFTKP